MIVIKGFYNVPKLNNNAANSAAVFGELTQYASTFTRDLKTYTKGLSQVNFSLFSCKDGNNKVEPSETFTDIACEVGDWAYEIGPTITNSVTKNDFANLLLNRFSGRISSVTCGEMLTDTVRRMPLWIAWDVVGGATTYKFKVWLSSLDFESSYDEFEIVIVPPVDKADKLFMPFADLLLELKENTLSVIHERMLTIKDRKPESILRTEMVELIDRANISNKVSIGLTALIYGPAGDTTDSIKDAIKLYLSRNSTNSESEWRLLMPDLFNTTCFYVIPRWDKFAIQSRLSMPGVHSPVVNMMEHFNFIKSKTAGYISTPHLTANLENTIHRYMNISVAIIGGEQNRLGLFKFSDYFPDYVAEESTSEDFNRQKQLTRNITNLFTTVLSKIDKFNKDQTLPVTIRFIEKYGQRFLVGKLENIEYYFLMKPDQQP